VSVTNPIVLEIIALPAKAAAKASTGWTTPEIATVAAAVIAAFAAVTSAIYSSRASRALDVRKHQRELRRPIYEDFANALQAAHDEVARYVALAAHFSTMRPIVPVEGDRWSTGLSRIESGEYESAMHELRRTAADLQRYGSRRARSLASELTREARKAGDQHGTETWARALRNSELRLRDGRERFTKVLRKDLDTD
jgi:hypothetical protein